MLRDSLAAVGTKFFVLLLTVVSVVVQARALGPEGRGQLAALIVLAEIMIPFAGCGANHAMAYYVGRAKFDPGRLYGTLWFILAQSSLLATAAVIWFQYQSPLPFTTIMIVGAALTVPVSVIVNALKGVALGRDRIAEFNRIFWLEKLVMVGALLALWIFDALTVTTALLAMLASGVVVLVTASQIMRPVHWPWRIDFNVAKQLLSKGMVLALTVFLLELLLKLDIYLLSWLSAKETTGHYAVALQAAAMLWQIPLGISVVILARSANRRDSSDDWAYALARAVRMSLWGVIAIGVAAACVAPIVFPLLLGAEFAPSVPLFQLLVPGIVLLTVFQLLHMNLAGEGRVWVPLLILLPCVLVKSALAVWVIPRYGAEGAAIVSSVAYATAALGMAAYFSLYAGLRITDLIFLQKPDFELLLSLSRNFKRGEVQ